MYKKIILKNGLKTIFVPSNNTDIVTVMMIFGVGSRYEKKEENGISHFLEHLFFKGTKKRPTQKDIAITLDSIGGIYNAFTSKEYTYYFAKVDKSYLELAFDFLSDILLNSKFEEKEMEKERGVILQEYNMYLDTPISYIGDLFEESLYDDQPIGWSVIGKKENIKRFKREDFLSYLNRYYLLENAMLVLAGNFKEKEMINLALKYFKNLKRGFKKNEKIISQNNIKPKIKIMQKKTDQTHISIGVKGYNLNSKEKYAQEIISVILGGNMSSRFFQKIRTKLGISYYIYTSSVLYTDHGYLTTSLGVPHEKVKEVIKLILKEYKNVKDGKILPEEIKMAKEYLKGNLTLSLDNSESEARFYAFQEFLTDKILTPDQLKKEIDNIATEDIKKVAKEIFKKENLNLAIIGPQKENDFLNLLKI
ncbi:MAG: M16 family metallopeptidase [Minisyncoccia bacterium]